MPRKSANTQAAMFPDGLTFDQLMERAKELNDTLPQVRPELPVEGEQSESSTAAVASSSSVDVVAGAHASAYTGSTSVIVTEAFSKIKSTMRAMDWCASCEKFIEEGPGNMVNVCTLSEEGLRMQRDNMVPPCMLCHVCAREDKHRSSKKDANGNSFCTICPKTLNLLTSIYNSQGKNIPRHLAVRNHFALNRCQPCGTSLYVATLRKQVADLQQSYTAEKLQNDRTERKLAARIEMAEKNASGQPAASHEEREQRRRQIRNEESSIDANVGEAAGEAVVEGGGEGGGDVDEAAGEAVVEGGGEGGGDVDEAELFGEEGGEDAAAECDEQAAVAADGTPPAYQQNEEQMREAMDDGEGDGDVDEAELFGEGCGEDAAAKGSEQMHEAMDDGEASAAEGSSEVGENVSRATGVAAARCEGDDDDDDDTPLATLFGKKRRTGGSTAVRSKAVPAAARSNAARKRPMTAAHIAADASDDDGDEGDEGGNGGATGPVDEAECQAIKYKCPKSLSKKYRQFIQTGKSTADWIAQLATWKTEAAAVKASNKEKIKNYDAIVKERDQAKQRAEAEAENKKRAVNDALKQGANKLKDYAKTIKECMTLLHHFGVAEEDVALLVQDQLLAETLFDKYPVRETATYVAGAAGSADTDA